jgi:transglutaminase-like putative cysteine protease
MKNLSNLSFRSTLSLLLVLVSLTFAGAAKAQLQQVAATPYDRQMTPVRLILEQAPRSGSEVTMNELNSYMRDLRSIPYQYSLNWKTPEQVQTDFKADCKAKAIALYSILKKRGVNDLRLVIGMRTKSSKMTHAWLEMNHGGKLYLLDPTFYNKVRTVSNGRRNDYVQNYAYEGAKKFRI